MNFTWEQYERMDSDALQQLLQKDYREEIQLQEEDLLVICEMLSRRDSEPVDTAASYQRFLTEYLSEN